MIPLVVIAEDELPTFNAELRTISCYRRIIERDRGSKGDSDGRKKLQCTKELSFIVLFADYRSPYVNRFIEEDLRIEEIAKDLRMPEGWVIDQELAECIEHYKSSQDCIELQYLQAAKNALRELRDFYNTLNMNARTDSGAAVYKPADIQKGVKEIPDMLEKLAKAEEAVKKALSFNDTSRGERPISKFEE